MKGHPWYKRFPSDFVAGTLGLSLEEKGAYSLLIDLMHDRGGPLDKDLKALSIAFGCSPPRVERILAALLAKGKLIETAEGRLSNPRVEHDLQAAAVLREKQRQNGRRSAELRQNQRAKPLKNKESDSNKRQPTRSQRLEADAEAEAEAEADSQAAPAAATRNAAAAVPNSGETVNKNSKASERVIHKGNRSLAAEFKAWFALYPRREARGPARDAYRAARRKVDAQTLEKAAKNAALLYAERETRYIPLPATWLLEERWTDEPPEPPDAFVPQRSASDSFKDSTGLSTRTRCAPSHSGRARTKAPPLSSAAVPPGSPWPQRLAQWRADGFWAPGWGPPPGEAGCQVPQALPQTETRPSIQAACPPPAGTAADEVKEHSGEDDGTKEQV